MSVGVCLVSPIPLLCISDDCFLCVNVSLGPIETPPNRAPNTLSSFKVASNFVCEVQQVSGVEGSPCGTVLFVSNKGMWNCDLLRL